MIKIYNKDIIMGASDQGSLGEFSRLDFALKELQECSYFMLYEFSDKELNKRLKRLRKIIKRYQHGEYGCEFECVNGCESDGD